MNPGEILRDDQDLDYAIALRHNVSVWENGQIANYGGLIEKHTEHAVKINGVYYAKGTYEFRVR